MAGMPARARMCTNDMVNWSPAETDSGDLSVTQLDALRALYPEFSDSSRAFTNYWGPLFKGEHLKRFELLSAFPGSMTAAERPAHIRALLGWDDTEFPGAYSPQR